MKFVKSILSLSGGYQYKDASDIEMNILGDFLISDVYRPSSFREWFFDQSTPYASGNLTSLKKENGYVFLWELYSEETSPTKLKVTYFQFLKLLDDWEEKVLKPRPKEVIIKYENDEFTVETKS